MKQRAVSIDALRGIAILGMVLSGSIAFNGVLPAWMYHAQVPPPLHKFNPAVPGITWVDLVFPFFLFAMGAAMPLALKKKLDEGAGPRLFFAVAFKRFLLLAFFAIFTQHMKAWVIAEPTGTEHYLLSLLAFILLFFQFYRPVDKPAKMKKAFLLLKFTAYAAAVALLYFLPFRNGAGFDARKSDIILLVLANMALVGTLIYGFTHNKPLLRFGVLPFVMAMFFAAKEPATSWTKDIFEFSHIGAIDISWLFSFYFMKYLFIVIPGTFAGEWFLKKEPAELTTSGAGKNAIAMSILSFIIIFTNLYGLFTRVVVANLFVSVILSIILLWLVAKLSSYFRQLVQAGVYLLLLGLFFDAFEGGIKKDPSTYSYYFVCSGLAFFFNAALETIPLLYQNSRLVKWITLCGQNPMVAYVAGSLLLTPLLRITGTQDWLDMLNTNSWTGLLKGVIYTAIVAAITIFFTRRKWYWRT